MKLLPLLIFCISVFAGSNRILKSPNDLELHTNSEKKLTIESSGNLIVASTAALEFESASSNPLVFAADDDDTGLVLSAANTVELQAGGTDVLTGTSSGVAVTGTLSSTGDMTASAALSVTGLITSSSDSLIIGDGTDTDKFFYASNSDSALPALKYDSSSSAWQFSDDGSTFSDLGASTTASKPISYSSNAANAITTGTLTYIDFEDKTKDDDDVVLGEGSGNVTTTNTGWRWVAPKTGTIVVTSLIRMDSADFDVDETADIRILKNNSLEARSTFEFQASLATPLVTLFISKQVEITSGQRIEIGVTQNAGANVSPAASGAECYVNIHYIED